jgi:hypothetical protein
LKFTPVLGLFDRVVGTSETALVQFFPKAFSSGEIIDKGFYAILFGVALGTLAEIRCAL